MSKRVVSCNGDVLDERKDTSITFAVRPGSNRNGSDPTVTATTPGMAA